MRSFLRNSLATLAALLFLGVLAVPLAAQKRDAEPLRLSNIARGAVELYNAAGTTRVTGSYDVPSSKSVTGDVAVLNGPVTISGTIEGSLVAINADVRFAPGARIREQLIVVGGTIDGQDGARIGGEIRVQAELLRYRIEDDRLIGEREPEYDDSWWKRHSVSQDIRRGEAYTEFFYVASKAYNRVEGWSVVVGPRFQRTPDWGKISVEAFGVVRTANPVQWDNRTLGHEAKAELQFGRPIGFVIGARAFDVVAPNENWQLSDGEVGLSSALLHRDYRDYFGRHGAAAYVRLQGGRDVDLSVSLSDEQWGDVRERDPWSLMRGRDPWRSNPVADVGAMHLLTTRLRVDTREREGSPWAGWYAVAEVENGSGTLSRLSRYQFTGNPADAARAPVSYSRGLVDLRRYNRISRNAMFNMRVAAAGWLSGDRLPGQRQLSLGGPGSLPGYEFRGAAATTDYLRCSNGILLAGSPAMCDRVALAQLELRSGFFAGSLRDDGDDDWWRPGFNRSAQWVLFADAGRGWNVGTPNSTTTFAKGEMPPLASYRTDIGAGVDFGGFGFYWAKAVTENNQPVRFFMRLERRF